MAGAIRDAALRRESLATEAGLQELGRNAERQRREAAALQQRYVADFVREALDRAIPQAPLEVRMARLATRAERDERTMGGQARDRSPHRYERRLSATSRGWILLSGSNKAPFVIGKEGYFLSNQSIDHVDLPAPSFRSPRKVDERTRWVETTEWRPSDYQFPPNHVIHLSVRGSDGDSDDVGTITILNLVAAFLVEGSELDARAAAAYGDPA